MGAHDGIDRFTIGQRRGTGVALSTFVAGSVGFDCLFVVRPDGILQVNTGIGNLGTEAFSDCHRVVAEMMGVPWEKVEIVWGNSTKNLPWSCNSGGSQTIHAHTRTSHAAATDAIKKLQEIAAQVLGDRRDLTQKAMGWMLREVGKRVDRDLLTGFLAKNAADMGRTALSYACEHLTADERAHFRAAR